MAMRGASMAATTLPSPVAERVSCPRGVLASARGMPGRVSGTNLWTPDLVKFAEAFGGRGVRVECNTQAADAVAAATANPGITVIDVVVDPENISAGTSMSSLRKR